MSPEDIKKLLGGYATGTLTAEERQTLFTAALEDQELFDALAREQSLRDLLRDPAARAELLSALDTPAGRTGGFWQWLRRPVVAGLATAGVAAITVVAVWQGTRVAPLKLAEPVIVADLKRPEPLPALSSAPPAAPARQPEASTRTKAGNAPAAAMSDKKTSRAIAAPPAPVAIQASIERRDATDVAAPAMAPPPPPPAPAAMPALTARKAEGESTAAGQSAGAISPVVPENLPFDARALFYLGQLAPGANAFVEPSGGGGAAPPPARPAAPQKDATPQKEAAPRTAKAVTGFAASLTAPAPRLGVRISILRGQSEADLATVLDPDESVRLKLTPNADGFLYVVEGSRMVASGKAQRLRPFETPELRFEGSGQKQLYVLLSRRPETVFPRSLGSLARDNLVETSPDQERATYVVSGARATGAQQVVVPVTLTYR
jgi:hypothetical protein